MRTLNAPRPPTELCVCPERLGKLGTHNIAVLEELGPNLCQALVFQCTFTLKEGVVFGAGEFLKARAGAVSISEAWQEWSAEEAKTAYLVGDQGLARDRVRVFLLKENGQDYWAVGHAVGYALRLNKAFAYAFSQALTQANNDGKRLRAGKVRAAGASNCCLCTPCTLCPTLPHGAAHHTPLQKNTKEQHDHFPPMLFATQGRLALPGRVGRDRRRAGSQLAEAPLAAMQLQTWRPESSSSSCRLVIRCRLRCRSAPFRPWCSSQPLDTFCLARCASVLQHSCTWRYMTLHA